MQRLSLGVLILPLLVGQLIRVCVCVCVFINHEKLAHSTVIQKSHDLPSTSWRPSEKPGVKAWEPVEGRAGGGGQQGLLMRYTAVQEQQTKKLYITVQTEVDKGASSSFHCLFLYSGLNRLMMPTQLLEREIYFTESSDSNANPTQSEFHRHIKK